MSRPSRRRVPVAALLVAVTLVAAGCRYTAQIRLPDDQPESSEVLWSDGSVLTTLHSEQNREPVTLGEMAPTLPRAVVAIEDERFFDHDGVDARGVLRALTRNVEAGKVEQGGSTITQQYVRAVMLGPERDLERKMREAVLALQLEQRYSKRTILERYLNTIYLGNGAYGVQAASHLYFGRDAKNLTLAQSALLAGMIRAPEIYNPYVNPRGALERRNEVLDKLASLHREPAPDVAAARATPIELQPQHTADRYPAAHFVQLVHDELLQNPALGPDEDSRRRALLEGGLRIHTTLDPKLQLLAESAVRKTLTQPTRDPAAALVAMDPQTGAVRAYVGGPDYFGTAPWAKVDLASDGLRQAGSTFKAFVLSAALEAGYPLSRTYDAPARITIPLPGGQRWDVRNYEDEAGGRMNLTEATVHSVNTVYAQLIRDVGAQPVVDLAAKMGVRSPQQAVPSAALGTNGVSVLDMTDAYATLAADGVHTDPVTVTEITKRDGTVLWSAPKRHERVLPTSTSRTVTQVLQQVVTRGTGINARIGRPVAGKTGTSDLWSDAWFIGYTPDLVAGVWVGFPDAERSMRPPTTRITVTGGSWPAQIWQQFVGAALAETPATPFPAPDSTVTTKPSPTSTTAPHALFSAVGMPVLSAAAILQQAGYVVRTREVPSRAYPPGIVVAQNPPAGQTARPGSTVTLDVASGPPRTVVVPTVLGSLADDGAATLRDAGFEVDIRVASEPPPGDPARTGRVWKQSPIGGTLADSGITVVLWVNP